MSAFAHLCCGFALGVRRPDLAWPVLRPARRCGISASFSIMYRSFYTCIVTPGASMWNPVTRLDDA